MCFPDSLRDRNICRAFLGRDVTQYPSNTHNAYQATCFRRPAKHCTVRRTKYLSEFFGQKFTENMIKIITTAVCAISAIVMLIISLATTYWLQWVIVSEGHNITHFRGLFRQCWESRQNETGRLIEEGCTDWFDGGLPDWTGAVVAFIILAMLCHLIAFILALVNACRKGEPFPVYWVCGLFFFAALFVIIGLLVYTFSNWTRDVYFSWSYGGGWSTVALSIIALVLIMADR